MSSIPVNNNLNVLANIANQMPAASEVRNALSDRQGDMLKDTFDMVMSRVSSVSAPQTNAQSGIPAVSGKIMSPTVVTTDSSNNSGVESTTQSSQKTTETDKTTTQADKTESGKTVSDDEKAAVTEAGEKLVKEVADEMGVTTDEVEEAMEILGLSMIQLFDPENMKQLLIALSGNTDDLAIVTDGELFEHFQNLLDMIGAGLEDLQAELGLTEEELNTLLADMAVVEKPEEDTLVDELPKLSDDEPKINLEGMKDYAVTVHKDGETVEVKVKVDDVSGEQTSKEEVQATVETQTNPGNKSGEKDLFGGSKEDHKGEAHNAGNFVTQDTTIEHPDFNEISQQPVAERYVSTEDIMNQIMEFMKINLKGDIQQLEMHLHPASLGNVFVQIVAKEGMVTAQFIAQNETVKAAIESQLVQLKEQFEEQGIKVNEVEVAVGNYRYEHSFAGDEENKQENAENGKKTRKNINLDELDLDELPEDMDDSERLTAEMMALHGNTIDYTA